MSAVGGSSGSNIRGVQEPVCARLDRTEDNQTGLRENILWNVLDYVIKIWGWTISFRYLIFVF